MKKQLTNKVRMKNALMIMMAIFLALTIVAINPTSSIIPDHNPALDGLLQGRTMPIIKPPTPKPAPTEWDRINDFIDQYSIPRVSPCGGHLIIWNWIQHEEWVCMTPKEPINCCDYYDVCYASPSSDDCTKVICVKTFTIGGGPFDPVRNVKFYYYHNCHECGC